MSRIPTTTAPTPHGDRLVPRNFVTDVIDADLRAGRVPRVVTRFPPEPNGYLHIGHAKAIALSFGVARDYGGRFHLRMDDTNPTTEDASFVQAIQDDMRWLGFEWDELRFASDYFDRLYELARALVGAGRAYVDSESEAAIRVARGTVTRAGTPSPFRGRSVEENLHLLTRMREGEFPDGSHVLRAKIDMAAPNMIMRDPVLYRIKHAHHYRSGDDWPIYPLYDFAHPLSDAIEGVTHSLCSLEFENNRAIYDWLVEALFPEPRPRQYEFARLFLDYTVLSKRRLVALVAGEHVTGWDDPRMPTIAGLRRRGVPSEALRDFALRVGVTRTNSRTDPALLDTIVRDALNPVAPRVMAVLDPLPVELRGAEGLARVLRAPSFPDDVEASGSRDLAFGPRILIERDDFEAEPRPGFKRLAPGRSVRLRHAYVITCDEVVRGDDGRVERLIARVHRDSLGTNPAGVRIWSAIHWVDAATALQAEFRLYGRLFRVSEPAASDGEFTDHLDPESLRAKHGVVESSVAAGASDTRYQFERLGYFWRDPVDGRAERLVFDRIVPLKDARGRVAADARGDAATRVAADVELPPPATGGEAEIDPLERLALEERRTAEALVASHGVTPSDAALLVSTPDLHRLLRDAMAAGAPAAAAATWIANDVRRAAKDADGLPPAVTGAAVADLVAFVGEGRLTTALAREVLAATIATGAPPADVVASRGLRVEGDEGVLARHAAEAVAAHPREHAAYRGGKTGLLGFFVGEVMRATEGRADPGAARSAVERALERDGPG